MKKLSIVIISLALVLGLSQCKKKVTEITPAATPEVNGNLVHIRVNAGHGDKHVVYPESGAYVFENGDKLYVGNHGYYVGTLEYYNGAFSGDIEIADTCAAAYKDYLHFYFIGGAYTGELYTPSATNPTRSFEWSIADQTGSKLPIISYGHSTQKYSKKATAYSCMLENKCGLVKFWAWPTPSTSNTLVTISEMKTTALIDFANPGITAINDVVQTIYMPAIKANTYYGGYNGISVGLEYVDLGLSVDWAACNVGSCTHEGYGKFFAWGETASKKAYCWSHYAFAQDPDPTDGDTIHWEYPNDGANLWLTKYNTQDIFSNPEGDPDPDGDTILEYVDDAARAIMGNGWRTPTVEEWNELIEGTTPTRDEVNGIGGIRFTATNGNSIFLPFAGFYSGPQHSAQYNGDRLPVGEYWSNEIDSDKPYQAWCLYIDDPTYGYDPEHPEGSLEHIRVTSGVPTGTDDVGFIRNEGRPVRAVRDR